VTALSLSAVGGTRGKTGIALAADLLVAVVLAGKDGERRLNHTTTKSEHQVESRFLLDVVVSQSAAVLELLASENKTLLIRGNSFLILDLLLDLLDGVGTLDLKGDGLSSKSLDEDLHLGACVTPMAGRRACAERASDLWTSP